MAPPYRSAVLLLGAGVGLALSVATAGPVAPATAAAVNERLGVRLFQAGQPLWDEPATAVAARLGLQPTSETGQGRTWVVASVSVLGLPTAEVRLTEGGDGTPAALELNVINKGDYFTETAMRRRLLETPGESPAAARAADLTDPRVRRSLDRLFRKDLEASERAASAALTALFGDSRRQSFRQAERQRLQRWDWEGTAFLLDARKNEFVMVRILPARAADVGGRSERRTDREVKLDLAANVTRGTQGDVWIRNIPVVDQGEKGYCAVATAERILRYYGIAVDSHDLADAAGTGKGGGTTWDDMCAVIERIAGRNQRQFRVIGNPLSARSVGRTIAKGTPLIWGLFVTPDLEAAARRRAGAREGLSAAEWGRRLKSERAETRRLRPDPSGAHLRLIVGYNEQTREIAYSDSWGDGRLYWITDDEAQAVSFPGACLATVLP